MFKRLSLIPVQQANRESTTAGFFSVIAKDAEIPGKQKDSWAAVRRRE